MVHGRAARALSARTWGPPSEAHFAEVEAVASVQLRFRSGRLANISSGYLGDKKRIEVFGSDAVATLDAATEYMSNRLMVRREEGTEEVRSEFGSPVQFDSEIDHLSRCILEDRDVLTPGEMGLRDCRLIEAVHRSAEVGGAWLERNEDGTVR